MAKKELAQHWNSQEAETPDSDAHSNVFPFPKSGREVERAYSGDSELVLGAIAWKQRWLESLPVSDQPGHVYHDARTMAFVARAAHKICADENMAGEIAENVELAAIFAFDSYVYPGEKSVSTSIEKARVFLEQNNIPEPRIGAIEELIRGAIGAEILPDSPVGALWDALQSHFARKKFFKRSDQLKLEVEFREDQGFSQEMWLERLSDILKSIHFVTRTGIAEFESQKEENLEKVQTQLIEIGGPGSGQNGAPTAKGVDTFFRTHTKNMQDLVTLSDRKAQMLVHINSIVASILLSSIPSNISNNKWFAVPAGMLLTVNLATILFAVLSVKPSKISPKKMNRKDLLQDRASITTHAIFNDITFEDFDHVIRRIMRDDRTLYLMMTQHLYGTGKVLQKKFSWVRIAYSTFMWGITAVVIVIGVILLIKK